MRRWLPAFLMVVVPVLARAGGGPQNALVVVNDNSPASLELGQYYQDARGIPERNLCHITTTTNYTIDAASFSNDIRGVVTNFIADSGLSTQIDYIVFSRDIPYQVSLGGSTNSLTSAMFYGFKTNADPPCSFPFNFSRSDYYEAERSFARSAAPSSNRYFLSALLVATNTDSAKRLVDRSVIADASQPTGTVYFYHTPDARNAHWKQFEESDFLSRFTAAAQTRQFEEGYFLSAGPTNALGFMVGQCCSMPINQVHFHPGALADHFTSYGGVLYEPSGQQSILEWIGAGAAGSYGTILEPCVFTQKFADARLHFWYARGFSMGESYYMSVRNPYEGVVVGDPLCAPYARSPSVSLYGLVTNQVVTGTVSVVVTGRAFHVWHTVDRIDAFMDGVFVRTLTNVAPAAGNEVYLNVNGVTYTQTVTAGQDVYQVASGLAALADANTGVSARARGDRIELKQRALGVAGTGITYSVASGIGTGVNTQVVGIPAGFNFAETIQPAIEGVTLSGVAMSGDIVRVVITRLDSVVVTNEVVATTNGATGFQLLSDLVATVNADTSLQDAKGCKMAYLWNPPAFGLPDPPEAYFVARTNTWEGVGLFLQYSIISTNGGTLVGPGFSDYFNDNPGTLAARGQVFLSAGFYELGATYQLSTTNLPDGPHVLTIVAYDGGGLKTQGRVTVPFEVDNNTLACDLIGPAPGDHFLRGTVVTAWVASVGTTTQVTLYVEGKIHATTNTPTNTFLVATTNLGAGAVGLQARADAGGQSVLSDEVVFTLYSDDDADGVSDQWEYRHFGSAATHGGTNDPDSDGVDNREEWIADTQPTNSASVFRQTSIESSATAALFRVSFISGTTRLYRVDANVSALTNGAGWVEATNMPRGLQGTTTWETAQAGTAVFYRVRVEIP